MSKLKDLLATKSEYWNRIKREGKQAVKEFIKEWFDAHPEYYGLKWEQYTPYFNDGDPCVFTIYGVYGFKTKEQFEAAEDCAWDAEGAVDMGDLFDDAEDAFEVAFGDPAKVSATRKKIEVEECEHD